jgi:hypothetical protein
MAACATPSGAGTAAISPTASLSEPAQTRCPDIELNSPTGERLNLTGTWEAQSGTWIFYVYQSGACVWWSGGYPSSQTPDTFVYDGLGLFTMVFEGEIGSDFTITGSWAEVKVHSTAGQQQWGTLSAAVLFDPSDGHVTGMEVTDCIGGCPVLDLTLTKVSDDDIPLP